jgi:hypothetical protein
MLLEQEQSVRLCKKTALMLADLFHYDSIKPPHPVTLASRRIGLFDLLLDRFALHPDRELR